MNRTLLLLLVFSTTFLWSPVTAQEKEASLEDEMRLKNAFLKTDGPGLVGFLSLRARGEATHARLKELVASLDAKNPLDRQKACAELVAIGSPSIPMLRQAARDADNTDMANLARKCLQSLEGDTSALTVSAIRLLANRKPAGTAEALMAYLPHAENESVTEELQSALAGVAHENGKPNPALLKALDDESPLRRASAIVALCARGTAEPQATLRKLLTDPAPSVRLRAAMALAQAGDAKAVSTLVLLLGELPMKQGKEVESFLMDLAGDLAPKVTLGDDDISRQKTRDAWAQWWLDTEGPGLLDELRKRTLTEADMTLTQSLIEKLGDDSFEVRQKSEDELKKLGAKIIPLLKLAEKNSDLEIRNRASKCLAAIEMDKVVPLSIVTARLISLRKPKGSVDAILAFMPFVDEESLMEELQTALNSVAYTNGKAHPSLLKAVNDKASARRAAAGAALCEGPLTEYLPQLRRLLKDKVPEVRLQVGIALAYAKQPEAVPVLISLVAEMQPEGSQQAEEYLTKLARDNGPKGLPEGDENRKRRGEMWEKWWTENKAKVVMLDRNAPAMRERYLGYTLLVEANNNQLIEWDKDKKVRWTMTGLLNPWDAQFLPSNRVLVTEYNGRRISERDLKGKILWQVAIPSWPMSAERLTNGQTFVVCRNMLLQYDRGGRQVYKFDRPTNDILSARRLANGQIVAVTSNRQIIRFDRNGKEVKTSVVPFYFYNQNEILNNGNVLICVSGNNMIIEYTADGKEVWRASVPQPQHAYRLPNGNTLVSSQNWPYRIYELDKKGKQIAETMTNNAYVFRVKRR